MGVYASSTYARSQLRPSLPDRGLFGLIGVDVAL